MAPHTEEGEEEANHFVQRSDVGQKSASMTSAEAPCMPPASQDQRHDGSVIHAVCIKDHNYMDLRHGRVPHGARDVFGGTKKAARIDRITESLIACRGCNTVTQRDFGDAGGTRRLEQSRISRRKDVQCPERSARRRRGDSVVRRAWTTLVESRCTRRRDGF